MPRMDKLSNYATTWEQEGDRGSVTYHQTRIVDWDADEIRLNTGGWDTVTTRRKMNQAARQFALGFSVYRRGHVTYVEGRDGVPQEFSQRATIDRKARAVVTVE